MNFEEFEEYWQNRRREGYLFDTPRSQIIADVRRAAQLREQKYARRSFAEITILTIVILIALVAIALSHSLAARSGIALLAAGLVLQLAPSFRINSMERNKRYDLPQQQSLIEERKRVAARIRHMKRQTIWYLLPIALGLTLLCIAKGCALDTIAGFVTGVVTASIAYYVYQRRQARKTLIPIMKDIDRELEALRRVPRLDGN
jgi:small-conductance mechanosensitive channel